MTTSTYAHLSTAQVSAALSANRAALTAAVAAVATLKQQLEEAQQRRAAATQTRHHLKLLRRWRKRTGRDDGDAVTEMNTLVEQIDIRWRVLRVEQTPGADLKIGTCTLTLRDPDKRRVRVVFDGLVSYSQDHGQTFRTPLEQTTIRVNQAVWSAFTVENKRDQRYDIYCRKTRGSEGKAGAIIEVHGEVRSIETLEK